MKLQFRNLNWPVNFIGSSLYRDLLDNEMAPVEHSIVLEGFSTALDCSRSLSLFEAVLVGTMASFAKFSDYVLENW